jgi:PleD family two-component response regulator
MEEQFNINIFSNDPEFCSSLAVECNKYGFGLTFFEESDFDNKKLLESAIVSVVIIDLTTKSMDPYKMGKNMRVSSDLPIFGILDRFNRKDQNKAKNCGFDLVFTKTMLLRSIKEIVVHISNEE